MSDAIRKLQEELRDSSSPVSTFYLVKSDCCVGLLKQKLGMLTPFGIRDADVNLIGDMVMATMKRLQFDEWVEWKYRLRFCCRKQDVAGGFEFRNIPGKGYEVELILPGHAAAVTPGFLDTEQGFFTAYMPPAFYR